MKKIIVGLLALAAIVTIVSAGVLTGSDTSGTKTYCYYSDGSVIVIDGMGVCDATN